MRDDAMMSLNGVHSSADHSSYKGFPSGMVHLVHLVHLTTLDVQAPFHHGITSEISDGVCEEL